MPGEPSQPQDLNEADFLRLFVGNEEALRAFARVLLHDWEAVDEVMQESSVVMWRKLGQLDGPEGFLPWAKVIVRFEALKYRRNRARDRLVFSDETMELLADEAENVDENAARRERQALRKCLSKLGQPLRELVLLPYVRHGAVSEQAEQSGRTVNSLYKQIGRLREKLQECVEGQLAKG